MANPNIVNVTSIYGKTSTVMATTSLAATDVVANNPSSGQIYKVNTLLASNVGSSAQTVSLWLQVGQNPTRIINNISVPAASVLTLIDKSMSIYLEEDQKLVVDANADNAIQMVVSYEVIS